MKTIDKIVLSALFIAFLTMNTATFAQVGIGTTGDPDASSMLDIQSNAKGVLIPRMTKEQRLLVEDPDTGKPANGLLVFDTTTNSFWFYSGASWVELASGGKLVDADGDTRVEVEETADEDMIRFTTAGTEYMQIGLDGAIKLGNRSASTIPDSDTESEQNYTKITADGSLSYVGNATRWDDLKVPVNSIKVGNTTEDAKWDKFLGNTLLLWFENNKSQDVVFTVQMPHAWKEGTDIMPHVHWTTGRDGASDPAPGSNTVTWNLEYTWANVGEIFSAPSGTKTGSAVAAPNTGAGHVALNEHVITPLGSILATDKTLSSMLVCRLYRSDSDTYSGNAGLLEIDFHYQIDSDGSNEEYIKR